MQASKVHLFKVQGMTCGHCVRAITQVIQSEDPDARIDADLPGAQVTVGSVLAPQRIIELIAEEGYQAQL